LRNIFDQYSQPENRITHALMTALQEDRKLLALFLGELVQVTPPCRPDKLFILDSNIRARSSLARRSWRRGIPDGWIFDDEGCCVFIESKVIAKLAADQINQHRRTSGLQSGHRSCHCPTSTIHLAR
jgi:hypothetical protein